MTLCVLTCHHQRALSPEEDMETSSAFHPDNQKHTATTKRPTKQSTAHNGYAPAEYQSHQVPSATQCSAPKTEAATYLAATCHSLPKPWPSASGEGCSLQSGWGSTILSSESSAYSTANEDKTKEPNYGRFNFFFGYLLGAGAGPIVCIPAT
ncbi:unnamed protein product [Boreogadus saida]